MLPTNDTAIPETFVTNLDREVKKVIKECYNKGIQPDGYGIMKLVGTLLQQQVFDGYGKNFSNVELGSPDDLMLGHLVRNVWQFSGAKNWHEMRDFTNRLKDEQGNLKPFSDFQSEALAIDSKYNKVWLRTEYDFAVGSATQSANWTRFKKNADIMPYLQYSTVGDARVRQSHQSIDGVVRKIDDAFWDSHYPPLGWGCRCTVNQLYTSHAHETDHISEVQIQPMFKSNLAKRGLIFPEGHPYWSGIGEYSLSKTFSDLPADTFYHKYETDNTSIDINLFHNKDNKEGILERNRHIEICNDLSKLGYSDFKLLPSIHENDIVNKPKFYPKGFESINRKANPDCWMKDSKNNDLIVDFKYLNGNGKHYASKISEGAKQANYVVLKLQENHSVYKNNTEKVFINKLKDHPDLKGIIILNHDGSVFNEIFR